MEPSLEAGLAKLRRARTVTHRVFLGYVPVCGSVLFLIDLLGFDSSQATPFVVCPYVALLATLAIRERFGRCPRCGRLFYGRMFAVRRWWDERCVHCGLPSGAPTITARRAMQIALATVLGLACAVLALLASAGIYRLVHHGLTVKPVLVTLVAVPLAALAGYLAWRAGRSRS